jgi:hypothetical protein
LPLSLGVVVTDALDFEAGAGIVTFTINLGTLGDELALGSLFLVPLSP